LLSGSITGNRPCSSGVGAGQLVAFPGSMPQAILAQDKKNI
jgi:hypothetical protein